MTSKRDVGARVWRKFLFFQTKSIEIFINILYFMNSCMWSCRNMNINLSVNIKEKPPILVPLRTEMFLHKHWRKEDKIYFFLPTVSIRDWRTYYLSYYTKNYNKKDYQKSSSVQFKHMHSWILLQNTTIFHSAQTVNIARLRQQCHNSKLVIFQEKLLKVLKCYTFLWVQRRQNCSPGASSTNCVIALYLLIVHLQTFLSILITKKCQILSCDTLVANERYVLNPNSYVQSVPSSSFFFPVPHFLPFQILSRTENENEEKDAQFHLYIRAMNSDDVFTCCFINPTATKTYNLVILLVFLNRPHEV
jgi:hypothetical protein